MIASPSYADLHPVTCNHGHRVSPSEYEFLDLSSWSVQEWQAGAAPLGLTRERYREFRESLEAALDREQVRRVDVRLQGSSVRFWSGVHKEMPRDRSHIVRLFEEERPYVPTPVQLSEIEERLHANWPQESSPCQRPFDSFFRLGISQFPSDIDVQISCSELVERARDLFKGLGLPASEFTVKHEGYGFVKKQYIEMTSPYLRAWAQHRSDVLGREVTIAVFDGSGPEVNTRRPELSSHFRDTDWVVVQRVGNK